MATTAKEFVKSKHIPHNEQVIYANNHFRGHTSYGRISYKLEDLLEEYFQLRLKEMSSQNNSNEDTITT